MELSDKAYRTYRLLQRASCLMNDYPNDVEDIDILEMCEQIARFLKEKYND